MILRFTKYFRAVILFTLPFSGTSQQVKPISNYQSEMMGTWKLGDCELNISYSEKSKEQLVFSCAKEGLNSPFGCCLQPAIQIPADSNCLAEFYYCGGWQQPIFEYQILELNESEMTVNIKVDYVMAPNLQPEGKRIVEEVVKLTRE